MTLYELTDEWSHLLYQIEESQGALTPEMEDKLNQLTAATGDKIDKSLDVLANLEAMEEAQKRQADRMRKRSQQTGKAADLLRERIQGAVKAMGGKHVSSRWNATLTTGRPAIKAKNDSVNGYDLDRINPRFVRVETTKSLDLEKLAMLSDEELEKEGFERRRKPFLKIT